jgi:hypothetical protein
VTYYLVYFVIFNEHILASKDAGPSHPEDADSLVGEFFSNLVLDKDILPSSSPPQHPVFEYISEDNICTGQLVEWTPGSVWETYAIQSHENGSIGWNPVGFEDSNWVRLQSKLCQIYLQTEAEVNCRSCDSCFSLLNSKKLQDFLERAKKDTVPHTPWKFLNARQLKNMVVLARKTATEYKFQVRSLCRIQKKIGN